jgi:uncharacterized damage-inducible protein DinB
MKPIIIAGEIMTHRCLKLGAVFLTALATAQLCPAQAPMGAPSATAATMPAPAGPTQGPLLSTLRTQWESTRGLVLAIAEIVPEDKYDYRATPDVRTFREIFIHLAQEGYNFMGPVSGEPAPNMSALNNLKGRDEILAALKASYDYGEKIIAGLTDEKASEMVAGRGGRQAPRWSGILGQIVDNMDHYGNLVTYVRLNGLVPPRTAARGAGRGGAGGGGRGGPPPQGMPQAPAQK